MVSAAGLIVGLGSLTVFIALSILLLVQVQPSTPPSLLVPPAIDNSANVSADILAKQKNVALRFATCGSRDVKCPCIKNKTCSLTTGIRLISDDCPSTFNGLSSCKTLNTWSISETNVPTTISPLGGPAGAVSSGIETAFSVTAVKSVASPLGVLMSAGINLVITNRGTCTANLSSLVIILEQTTSTKLINWASSGSENPTTAGQCNTPGLAAICVHGDSLYESDNDLTEDRNVCSQTVPYISNLVTDLRTLNLVNLGLYPIPASAKTLCTNSVQLRLESLFSISPSNWTLMSQQPNNYTIRVLFTYSSCCGGGSSCSVNVDCRSGSTCIKTNQLVSPPFQLASTCAPYCDCVQVATQPISVQDNENTTCSASAELALIPAGQVCASTTYSIQSSEICDTRACGCKSSTGAPTFQPTIGSSVSLSNPACVNPVTGASLITPSSASAVHPFKCSYPAPTTDCGYSPWSEWSSISQPCSSNCNAAVTRTRTAQPSVCHGDTLPSCLDVQQSTVVPCTDSGFTCAYGPYDSCSIDSNPCTSPSCTSSGTQSASVSGISNYCVNGAVVVCEKLISRSCTVPCTLPCSYSSWGAWSSVSSPCDPTNCNPTITRNRTAIPSACPGNTALECSLVVDSKTTTCSDVGFACTYDPYGPCISSTNCSTSTCTQEGVKQATSSDFYCLNGNTMHCNTTTSGCIIDCTVPCTYTTDTVLGPCQYNQNATDGSCVQTVTVSSAPNACTSSTSCTAFIRVSSQVCACPVATPVACVPLYPTTCEALIVSVKSTNPGAECMVNSQPLIITAQCGNAAILCPFDCAMGQACQEISIDSPFGSCIATPVPTPVACVPTLNCSVLVDIYRNQTGNQCTFIPLVQNNGCGTILSCPVTCNNTACIFFPNQVIGICAPECTTNSECDDNNICTIDICQANQTCTHEMACVIVSIPPSIYCRYDYQDKLGPAPNQYCVCNSDRCKAAFSNGCVNAFCAPVATGSVCETVPVNCDDGNANTVDTCIALSNTTNECTHKFANFPPLVITVDPSSPLTICPPPTCYKSNYNTTTQTCDRAIRDPTCCTVNLPCADYTKCTIASGKTVGTCTLDTSVITGCTDTSSVSCTSDTQCSKDNVPSTCVSTGKCSVSCNFNSICNSNGFSCISNTSTCVNNQCIGGTCRVFNDATQCNDNRPDTEDICDPINCPHTTQCKHCSISSRTGTYVNFLNCFCSDGSFPLNWLLGGSVIP